MAAHDTRIAFPAAANDEYIDGGPYMSARSLALTARERQILALLAEGLTNKGIATRLSRAAPTVATHLRRIYEKLGAHTRTEAIALARARGVMGPRIALRHQTR
jgi:DNA-binding NarL/FixJ family response regulator